MFNGNVDEGGYVCWECRGTNSVISSRHMNRGISVFCRGGVQSSFFFRNAWWRWSRVFHRGGRNSTACSLLKARCDELINKSGMKMETKEVTYVGMVEGLVVWCSVWVRLLSWHWRNSTWIEVFHSSVVGSKSLAGLTAHLGGNRWLIWMLTWVDTTDWFGCLLESK